MIDSNPQDHGRPGISSNAASARCSASPNRAYAAARGVSRLRSAAPLLMVGVAVSTTGGSAFAVQLFSTLGPICTLWIRNLLAALILLVLAGRSFHLPPRDQLFRLAVLGVVLAACNASFYGALDRVPLSVAATVEFLGPLTVAVAGTRSVVDMAWAALAAAGVVLLASPTSALDPIGLLLALAAGACWAIYILLSKRLVHELGPVLTISGAFVVSAFALTPFALPAASAVLQWHVAGAALAVAVFSAGLPYLLELVALRLMPASTFSILLSLEPAAAALMGLAILGQHLGPVELLAIALVVIASAGANWRTGRAGTRSATIADSPAPLPLAHMPAPEWLYNRLVYAFTLVRLRGRLRERSPP
jgi:inner membrane transporter RhtA